MTPAFIHSDRLARAFDYAAICHAAQRRKGTGIPYLSHLIGVASLVMEAAAEETDQAELEDLVIAALLHDANGDGIDEFIPYTDPRIFDRHRLFRFGIGYYF